MEDLGASLDKYHVPKVISKVRSCRIHRVNSSNNSVRYVRLSNPCFNLLPSFLIIEVYALEAHNSLIDLLGQFRIFVKQFSKKSHKTVVI